MFLNRIIRYTDRRGTCGGFIHNMKRSFIARLGAALLSTIVLSSSAPIAAQPLPPHRLGTNLLEVNDYSPQLPFVNIFSNSRPWFTQCEAFVDPACTYANAWDTGEAGSLALDDNGWIRTLHSLTPAAVFTSAATYWDIPAEFPGGRYVVLYDGQGTIEYRLGAADIPLESQPGRDVVVVDPSKGGILLRITSTDPNSIGNYIRNIRFVSEANESRLTSNRFSQEFLDRLAPYQALRFMDWMRTNNSIVTSWGSRAKPSHARYSTEAGVPLEVMIELANTADKAPWFNMPHQADDNYVRMFASLTKSNLASHLPVYVEYSNEVWNSIFSQSSWVQTQAEQLWPSGSDGFMKRLNWFGKRSAEICDIWREVFGDSSDRVICAMASQAANSWTAEQALLCPLWNEAPCVAHGIRALAIAPYFGDYLGQEENFAHVLSWTQSNDGGLTNLFNELEFGGVLSGGPPGGALAQSFGWIDDNLQVANQYHVGVIAYEGGQHLVGVGNAANSSALTQLFTGANRDPRIGNLYRRYLEGWAARGGGLLTHFTDIGAYSKYGSWGALERIGQTSSAKYDFLRSYILGPLSPTPTPTAAPRVVPPQQLSLRVKKRGRGIVLSGADEISCGDRCRNFFSRDSTVRLIARASRGYRFRRWVGACRHSRSYCDVAMKKATTVVASFSRISSAKK